MLTLHGLDRKLAGGASVLFFGACAIVFILQIIDSRPRLIINEQGVFDRTLGVGFIPFTDIEDAFVRHSQKQAFICLELRNENEYLAKLKPVAQSLVKANRMLGFTAINLNLSGVDADADAVCALVLANVEIARSQTPRKAAPEAIDVDESDAS